MEGLPSFWGYHPTGALGSGPRPLKLLGSGGPRGLERVLRGQGRDQVPEQKQVPRPLLTSLQRPGQSSALSHVSCHVRWLPKTWVSAVHFRSIKAPLGWVVS